MLKYLRYVTNVDLNSIDYNEPEISIFARGKFQSKTNVFHGFLTVQYSWRVY